MRTTRLQSGIGRGETPSRLARAAMAFCTMPGFPVLYSHQYHMLKHAGMDLMHNGEVKASLLFV